MTETTDLITLPDAKDLPSLYEKEGKIDEMVTRIETEVKSHAIDVSTPQGRKFATSLAAKVSSSKVLIENAGNKVNEEAKAKIAAVNAVKKAAVARLEKLRDDTKAPVKAWEDAEAERVRKIQQQTLIFDTDQLTAMSTADELKALILRIESVQITEEDFAEFAEAAEVDQKEALKKYRADLQVAEQREEGERELAELRAEKARREKEDADRAAKEQAEREEAERKEREKREEQEREKERLEAEERRAEENRKSLVSGLKKAMEDLRHGMIGGKTYPYVILLRDLEDRIPQDFTACGEDAPELDRLRLEIIAELKEAQAKEAEANKLREAEEREAAEAESKRQLQEAADLERARIAQEQREKEEADAAALADANNRARVKGLIKDALQAVEPRTVSAMADAIIDGKIPNTKVTL